MSNLFRVSVVAAPLVALCTQAPRAYAQNCSVISCDSTDQSLIGGFDMFNESNFDPVVDAWGRTRSFFVHIPVQYDTVDGVTEKIPLIFAFHGGGQGRDAMIDGKWGDHFNDDIAFVVPLGKPDPCDNVNGNGPAIWMQPTIRPSNSPSNPNCMATQIVPLGGGQMIAYWDASNPGTFTDVEFIEDLRAMLLSRFPKLNGDKVYATGFSSGGGMTLSLLCYRSDLFRGFSVVAKTLFSDGARGDYNNDGIIDIDPDSLAATCGLGQFDAGRATGIVPHVWGETTLPPGIQFSRTRPVALFAGDQDNTMQEINDTGAYVRARNNLNGLAFFQNPYSNTQSDMATTQRRTFATELDPTKSFSPYRRFLVQGVTGMSATHAMPDADECPGSGAAYGPFFMTCDYSYTDETRDFFEQRADLSLSP